MHTPRRPVLDQAFTLIEIMVVVVILGLLAALVVPNVLRELQDSRIKTTQANARTILDAAKTFELHGARSPVALEDLVASDAGGTPMLERTQLVDAWNNPFELRPLDGVGRYEVVSPGADGVVDTADDIVMLPRDPH